MLNKRVEKEIDFYIEILKLLVFLLIATAGGTVGLLYKLQVPITLPIVILGLWLSISFTLGIVGVILKIRQLFKELRNE